MKVYISSVLRFCDFEFFGMIEKECALSKGGEKRRKGFLV